MIKNKLESLSGSKFRAFKLGELTDKIMIKDKDEGKCGTTDIFSRWGTIYRRDTWDDKSSRVTGKNDLDIDVYDIDDLDSVQGK